MAMWDTVNPFWNEKGAPRPTGDKKHWLILLVTSRHVPGPSQGAGLSWTLAAFPWDDAGSSWISPSLPVAALTHITFPLYFFSAWSEWACPAIPWGGCRRNSADTNLPYRLCILHPFLDIQEHEYTGFDSCSCTRTITFFSLRGFLHIANFQEKTKMCSCPAPQSLRNTNIIFQLIKQLHRKPSRHKMLSATHIYKCPSSRW